MNNNELLHYGILGMKWGVRRTEAQLARARSKGEVSEDYAKAHSKKSVRSMSDSELRSRLNRIQMEQQYAKVLESDIGAGRRFVNKAIKAGTTVATLTTTATTISIRSRSLLKVKKGGGAK